MVRNSLIVGGLFSLALFAGCASAPEAAAPAPAPAPAPAAEPEPMEPEEPAGMTLRDGAFTAAQADRGEAVFNESCVDCHAQEEWTDAGFLRRWNGQPVYRLYKYIHDSMPHDNPASLTEQQYTDVVSYIFELNSMPTGSTELPTDQAGQEAIQIDWIAGGR